MVRPTLRISCEGRDLLPWFTMTTEPRNRPTIVLRPASNRPSSASSACWVASRAFPTAVRASQTAGDSARQRPRDPNGTAPLPRQARRLSWLGGLDGQSRVRPPGHQAHELRRCSRRPIRKTPASEAYRANRGTSRMARTLPLPSWARRSKRGNVSFAPGVDTRPDYRARSASLWRRAPHRVHPTLRISCEGRTTLPSPTMTAEPRNGRP
jgi:hypothetical protein